MTIVHIGKVTYKISKRSSKQSLNNVVYLVKKSILKAGGIHLSYKSMDMVLHKRGKFYLVEVSHGQHSLRYVVAGAINVPMLLKDFMDSLQFQLSIGSIAIIFNNELYVERLDEKSTASLTGVLKPKILRYLISANSIVVATSLKILNAMDMTEHALDDTLREAMLTALKTNTSLTTAAALALETQTSGIII